MLCYCVLVIAASYVAFLLTGCLPAVRERKVARDLVKSCLPKSKDAPEPLGDREFMICLGKVSHRPVCIMQTKLLNRDVLTVDHDRQGGVFASQK